MNKYFPNPRITSRYLLVFGLVLIALDLIRHPEEWKNWLIRLGIMLIIIVILFFSARLIRFVKNRKPEQ